MAEVLTYSQSLTSMTGGRGDYHMEFLRYEEVPAHIAQKLIEAAKKEKEAVPGVGHAACRDFFAASGGEQLPSRGEGHAGQHLEGSARSASARC